MKKIIGESIDLKFSKKFYEEYKKDVEMNLGRKVSKEEVVMEMIRDLLGMYSRLGEYYK